VDVPVTVTRLSMFDRAIAVFTGTGVAGSRFFPHWEDLACRTKLAVQTRADVLLRNVDWRMFGVHRVAFYGNHRQTMKDLAALIGFDTVEEDA